MQRQPAKEGCRMGGPGQQGVVHPLLYCQRVYPVLLHIFRRTSCWQIDVPGIDTAYLDTRNLLWIVGSFAIGNRFPSFQVLNLLVICF